MSSKDSLEDCTNDFKISYMDTKQNVNILIK